MIFHVIWGNYRYQTAGFEYFTYRVYALINPLRYAIRYQFMEIILGFIVYSSRMYVTILRCPIQPYKIINLLKECLILVVELLPLLKTINKLITINQTDEHNPPFLSFIFWRIQWYFLKNSWYSAKLHWTNT